ncbi:hypothetical protein QH494_12745 [Sphingomonas sp. AR_OL41]|uniref:hypothetical protein n=1 Tax=Sphingomonas sp. AR_OL41 TaxID=3042729 RepID=UPI00248032AD|nr:hypothetical protein [Sphingomonas sp. AR_OL41]MDH7973048.1 hypothetical protein [Sphingomonas sp. AR_OL41]
MSDMSRARTKPEDGVVTIGLQASMVDFGETRPARRKILGFSPEEKRMAANAKSIRADAAADTMEDLTGLRGKDLMSRLLRK